MAEPRYMDRLTAQDLFTLWTDDFGWSQDIGALATLDGTRLLDGDGHIRIDHIRRHIEPRLQLVPRFRQLLYRPRLGLGWPLWVDAQFFDLADHVRVQPLAPPGDEAQLLQACAQLYQRRLDPTRPLWQLWLLPSLPDQQVGVFLRAHHTLADGVAGVAVFGALLDLDADAPPPVPAPWTPAPIPSAGALLGDNLRRRLRGLGRGLSRLGHASRPREASQGALREFFAERAPRTSLNRRIGSERRLAIVRSRLQVAKQDAHAHHAKVNDVVLAAVAGGLRQLLAGRGEDIDRLVLRVMVPISLHHEQPGQARGNQIGYMVVPLPLGEPNPVRRLELIAGETAARKQQARPQSASGILSLPVVQRASYRFQPHQRFVNLSVTNVPGPPVPLYLAGAQLLELFPVAPILGNLTLTVGVLSYAGQLNLTAMADQATCPDVEVFAQGVRGALDELARSALVPAS
ncbi:MAG TPA: wax ester/triacylglycerol synthase family O-acyltransferase [Actinomycetota bacterium]|nr:wax ester/triacylglycerol synthase family O-acyltransferase [Actinomycetota bacterium]